MSTPTPRIKSWESGTPPPRVCAYRVQPRIDELLVKHADLEFARWVVDPASEWWSSKFAERPGARWVDQHLRDGDHLVVAFNRSGVGYLNHFLPIVETWLGRGVGVHLGAPDFRNPSDPGQRIGDPDWPLLFLGPDAVRRFIETRRQSKIRRAEIRRELLAAHGGTSTKKKPERASRRQR